jgi:hypothetical protein
MNVLVMGGWLKPEQDESGFGQLGIDSPMQLAAAAGYVSFRITSGLEYLHV